jgi:hypothetical protein
MTKKSRRKQKGELSKGTTSANSAQPSATVGTPSPEPSATASLEKSRGAVEERIHRETKIGKLTWVLLGGVVGLLLTLAYQQWQAWYYRPKLEMRYSVSILASTGQEKDGLVENYAALIDAINKCGLVNYRVSGQRSDTQPWDPTSEIHWKILVQNTGRSTLTNIGFSLDTSLVDRIAVEASPNLAVDSPMRQSAPGAMERVATIREIPPGVIGVVTIKGRANAGKLVITKTSTDDFEWKVLNVKIPVDLRFEGSTELGKKATFVTAGTREILQRESQVDGASALRVPFVRDSALSGFVGIPVTWRVKIAFPTSNLCPAPPDSLNRFSVAWTAEVTRAEDDPKNSAQKK